MKRKRTALLVLIPVLLFLGWVGASLVEMRTGVRYLPGDPYADCGLTAPATLPETVTVGFYEEFPTPQRLAKLRDVDFPVSLAVSASSHEKFLELRASILREYPQVKEVLFWPLLKKEEGYYPGTWSAPDAVHRVADESDGLPVLWDMEAPLDGKFPSLKSRMANGQFLDQWLRSRKEPVAIWRSHTTMGLDPLFLHLAGLQFDPLEFPAVTLHLDMYQKGNGLPDARMAQIMRCGVERYGPRFVPSLGVLDDGLGQASEFVPIATLQRNLQSARAAGVSEVWLFGVNGITPSVIQTLHQTLPLPDNR